MTGDANAGEEGRQLVRVDPQGAPSLGHRLAAWFERLTWATPLHDQRLKGQHPVRLLAVPDDPLPGSLDRGDALLEGQLLAHGEARAFGRIEAEPLPAGLADHWHAFLWLRDLASVATPEQGTAIAERLAATWLARHGDRAAAPAWRPDLAGTRMQMWAAYSPLLLASADPVFRSRVLNAVARTARHLDRTADRAPPGAERIAAWCGVVTAGLLLPDGDGRRAFGEAGLARAFAASLWPDGGVVSRAPLALVAILEHVALLRAVYDAREAEMPAALAEPVARIVPALLGATLGDGGLSSWQGGGPVPAQRLRMALEANGLTGRPLRQPRDWGYQRMVAGGVAVIVDAAPPPLAEGIAAGSASTLAFEVSDGAERVIVNCGGAGGADGRLPDAFVRALRSTAAHSTLTLADSNSTAIHPDGSLGRGVGEVALARQESEAGSRIEASHDGYCRRHGFTHRRQLVLTADARELRGEDTLLPGRKRAARSTPFAIRFHLGAGVQAAATGDALAAILRTPSGTIWQLRAKGAMLTVEESVWIDAAARPVGTQQVVLSGLADAGGASVTWSMRRAR